MTENSPTFFEPQTGAGGGNKDRTKAYKVRVKNWSYQASNRDQNRHFEFAIAYTGINDHKFPLSPSPPRNWHLNQEGERQATNPSRQFRENPSYIHIESG
ncbi:hypothetical protein HK102_013802 [Quaeritorhiza haematococci]|nr:hypothetical protein HK102_013802 [Quaeritorhiza haematococci]